MSATSAVNDIDGIATASGFFASDTRFLSRSVLTLGGVRPELLSYDQPAPHLAAFVLRNALVDGLEPNELSIERERFVGDCMEERITVENHGRRRVEVELGLELEADFADIFVVKSLEPGFGTPSDETLPPPRPLERGGNGTLVFADASYPARTIVHLSEPAAGENGVVRFPLALEPGERWRLVVAVQPQLDGTKPLSSASFARELDDARAGGQVPRRDAVRLEHDHVVVGCAAGNLPRDDLLQLVHLEPVQDPLLDGVDQVTRFVLRVRA